MFLSKRQQRNRLTSPHRRANSIAQRGAWYDRDVIEGLRKGWQSISGCDVLAGLWSDFEPNRDLRVSAMADVWSKRYSHTLNNVTEKPSREGEVCLRQNN
ncbi:unnamed protein product [Ectocarpus sp. 8 AP-2014]